jgi:hypothetical protein
VHGDLVSRTVTEISRFQGYRKQFRPYGHVKNRRRRHHSKDRPRFPISAQCTLTSYLAPLPRYRGSNVDRKRFRPHGDVTRRKDDTAIRKTDPGFLLVLNACRPRHLAQIPRYSGPKVDRKQFRPYGDVTGRKRRRRSIDQPRFNISAQCTPTSYLAP